MTAGDVGSAGWRSRLPVGHPLKTRKSRLEELQRPETVVLTSQTEPIEDVVEVIGKLYADDPDVNQVAMAYADRVPVASLAAHLGWPKRKTQSALRRMYRRIKKSKSAKPRGSTPLPSLRPVPARRSGQNVIVPSVPKAGGFYCAGGTARWERLDSGCHVWTHGTGNWLNVPSDKSKKS